MTGRLPDGRSDDGLLTTVLAGSQRTSRGRGRALSLLMTGIGAGEALALASLYVVPVFEPESPERPDVLATLVYDPPPPPPPPLLKGSALRPEAARPPRTEPVVEKAPTQQLSATMTIEMPPRVTDEAVAPEPGVRPEDQFGSETGNELGDPLGMEEGVPGGVVGGLPGGVLGGVPGGTGTGPVPDFDAGPRLLRQTRPQYPQEAFVKKVEGTVLVEILIDVSGHVTRTRVLQSIPLLDEAARVTVMEWAFQPAMKHGRPVATIAHAPVHFRIY